MRQRHAFQPKAPLPVEGRGMCPGYDRPVDGVSRWLAQQIGQRVAGLDRCGSPIRIPARADQVGGRRHARLPRSDLSSRVARSLAERR